MKQGRILWADDEIDLLKAHVLFLESKGYDVVSVNNGQDAVDACRESHFDIIFLDENMPGLSGLEALTLIKEADGTVPVVMITKSEEENIMEQAIGKKIADYLIKPVNPNQILLSLKKNINKSEIIRDMTTDSYRSEFGRIGMQINDSLTFDDWKEVYKKIVYWELELTNTGNQMDEVLRMQKDEANSTFVKFIKKHYEDWFGKDAEERPMMSPDVFKTSLFPLLDNGEKVFFVVFDNFRYDQWRMIKEELSSDFVVENENIYCSILPTATQYARNAIFSGLMPLQMQKMYPKSKVITNFGLASENDPLVKWQQLLDYTNGHKGVIVGIDEIQNWFMSGTNKLPEGMLEVATQNRKNNRILCCTAQVFTRVNKGLREQVTMVYNPHTFLGCFTVVVMRKPEFDSEGNVTKLKYRGMYSFVHTDELRESYDTYKVIHTLAKEGFKDLAPAPVTNVIIQQKAK